MFEQDSINEGENRNLPLTRHEHLLDFTQVNFFCLTINLVIENRTKRGIGIQILYLKELLRLRLIIIHSINHALKYIIIPRYFFRIAFLLIIYILLILIIRRR